MSGAQNLSSGLILVSVVIDIERIGDYAKNIFDLARSHSARLHAGSIEPEVAAIEIQVADVFRKTVPAFRNGDVDQARLIKCEELADDVRALSTLVHALRTALVAVGAVKGGTLRSLVPTARSRSSGPTKTPAAPRGRRSRRGVG